jgi:hypothetical protein
MKISSIWRCIAMLTCLSVMAKSNTFGQTPSEIVQVQTPRGPVAAQVGVHRADIAFPSRTQPAAIVTAYEPVSGLFWWIFTYIDSASPTAGFKGLESAFKLYLVNDRLVGFRTRLPSLAIRESSQHATGLQDAMNKAAAVVAEKEAEIRRGTVRWYTSVDLGQLGRDFFYLSDRAATLDPAKLINVSFADGKWDVLLEGVHKERVLVTLSDSYAVVGTRPVK